MKKVFLGKELQGDISQIKESEEGMLPLNIKGYWLIKGIDRLVPNRTDLVLCHGDEWCTTVHKNIKDNPLRCTVNGVTPYPL